MKKLVMVGLLLALTACREQTAEEKKTTWLGTPQPTATGGTAADTTAAATGTHPASPGGTALVPEVDSGTTVLVMLNDNSIAVREQAIPPGPAVLTIENRGSDVHNLFVEGPGVNAAAGDAIPERQSATLDVTFKPGTYTLYCPIADHRKNGEQVTVTIAAP
jgi:plastocyanin